MGDFVALDSADFSVEVFAENWVWPADEEEEPWLERTLVYVGTERLDAVFHTKSIREKFTQADEVEYSMKLAAPSSAHGRGDVRLTVKVLGEIQAAGAGKEEEEKEE